MKSLFKRTLATATGSVLALSQLVSVAATVNVSAAETLVVDKAFVLNVPIDQEAPLKAEQVSDWSELLEAKFIELGDNHSFQFGTQRAKDRVKAFLERNATKYMSSEDIQAVLSKIAAKGTAVTNSNGSFTVTLACGDVGEIAGTVVQNLYSQGQVPIDWTQFHLSGQAVINGQFDFANKTLSYELTLIDETGAEYKGDTGIQEFAEKKLAEAKALCQNNDPTNQATVEKVDKALKTKIGYIRSVADAILGVSLSGESDPETAYADYAEAVLNAIKSSGIPSNVSDRIVAAINKRKPASLSAALTDERTNRWYNSVLEVINSSAAGVQVDFTTDDAVAILNEGYDYEINITNGYSGNAAFKLADDQSADLLDAIKSVYTTDGFIAGEDLETLAGYASDAAYQAYTVVDGDGATVTDFTKDYNIIDVVSHKEVAASAETNYAVNGELSYDVERVIEQIIVEEAKETTTTTTETTTSTTESTTTTTESTTTTTESTTTTTESTTTTTESTTTSTTTSSTTTESTTTTTETTTTDTTDTTTTTTLATYVSFDVGANGNNELIYWSEETDATFDFESYTIKAHFIVAGEDQTEDIVDVTEFFGAEANTPAEMGIALLDGVGSGKYPVGLILKDAAGLAAVIDAQGYDSESIMADQGFTDGAIVSRFYVILVLRGDGDLNGEVSVEDAQYCLNYYTDGLAQQGPAHTIRNGYYLTEFVEPLAIMPYSHYAMDAFDGDGVIAVEDAQKILQYYTDNTLAQKGKSWDEINDRHTIPLNELHADPLAKDALGKADYDDYMENRE